MIPSRYGYWPGLRTAPLIAAVAAEPELGARKNLDLVIIAEREIIAEYGACGVSERGAQLRSRRISFETRDEHFSQIRIRFGAARATRPEERHAGSKTCVPGATHFR